MWCWKGDNKKMPGSVLGLCFLSTYPSSTTCCSLTVAISIVKLFESAASLKNSQFCCRRHSKESGEHHLRVLPPDLFSVQCPALKGHFRFWKSKDSDAVTHWRRVQGPRVLRPFPRGVLWNYKLKSLAELKVSRRISILMHSIGPIFKITPC